MAQNNQAKRRREKRRRRKATPLRIVDLRPMVPIRGAAPLDPAAPHIRQFVRFKDGIALLGIGKSTAYRLLQTDPAFPRLVRPLGEGSKPSAFVDSELAAYQAARIAERDNHK